MSSSIDLFGAGAAASAAGTAISAAGAKKRAVIIASRPVSAGMRRYVREDDFIITADAGWLNAKALGLPIHLAVGDFDSSSPPGKAAEVLRLPAEKDDTDTHFATRTALERGYRDILYLGCTGGRADHAFANLQTLLFAAESGAAALLADEDGEARCVLAGQPLHLPRGGWRWLSVFAAGGAATGVNLAGVKYPLHDATLTPDYPLGTSNEFDGAGDGEAQAVISCGAGRLYVMVSRHE